MKISYNWLQTYFDKKLPAPKELAELFTMYAFEVESVDEHRGGEKTDYIFDVKILPNRAHDCLSHRGVAREVGTLLGQKIKDEVRTESGLDQFSNSGLTITRQDPTLCTRYSAAIIRGVDVGPSPAWLVERLTSIGQKSINNVVDATNFVMFSLGQPLHAFDLGKLIEKENSYSILVRNAQEGETMSALDGKTYTLSSNMLMITDAYCKDNKILGIAGVKGGTAAEIDTNTTAVLVESAHFDPISVRMTAKKLGLRTDASQRFENGLTPELTIPALQMVCELIVQIAGGTIDAVVDDRNPPTPQTTITLQFSDVEKVLGFAIPHKKIVQVVRQLGCEVVEGVSHGASGDAELVVTVPYERLDLTIKEDIIEEIGRVYGFFNVPPLEPTHSVGLVEKTAYNKTIACTDYIRAVLSEHGFSEVYTYSFRKKGERELQNPIASDKAFLRSSLEDGISDALTLNAYNAPLLQIHDVVKLYEIGNVFSEDSEHLSCAIGMLPVKSGKKNAELVQHIYKTLIEDLESMLGVSFEMKSTERDGTYVWEIDLSALIASLPEPTTKQTGTLIGHNIKYKKISPYPFMLRDIAVFVPEGTTHESVFEVIKREAGPLLVSAALFDVFTKKFEDGSAKTSYAYSLVFQSDERTLSDDEINRVMQQVTETLNAQGGWQVR